MKEENKLPPKELDKQDKQEVKEQKKEENKKTLKTVITSVICTLLFIIILLLLILLGLKKCMGRVPDIGDSSNNDNTSSEYVEIYDNVTLNDVFKKIVSKHLFINFDENKEMSDVIAVTYTDNYPNKFDLSITACTEDEVFFYSITNCVYQNNVDGYDNLVTYLLKQDKAEPQHLVFMSDSEIGDLDFSVDLSRVNKNTAEVINTNKPDSHFVTSMTPSSVKYISGYYYQDNKYYVYDRLEYTDQNNPLGNNEGTLIDDTSLLYGYYLRLSGIITN